MEAQIANIYIDFILKILYKIYYNMFGFGWFDVFKPETKTEPNRIELKLNRNFGNDLVGFPWFFRFISFLHTPT